MSFIYNDIKYISIVNYILKDKEYREIDNCKHHGTSRFDHCLRVSYYSYKVTRILGLNYKQAAIGGLLHDFFLTEKYDKKSKMFSMFTHPKKALANSNNYFDISSKEQDIIVSHMFPLVPTKIPKFAESWIVSGVDKIVGFFELLLEYNYLFKTRFKNAMVIMALFLMRLN